MGSNDLEWLVYLLQCADGTLYCGCTNNLSKRLTKHNYGKGAKYTASRRPLRLVWHSHRMSKSSAFKEEYRIKRLPRSEKMKLAGLASDK